MSNSDNLFKGMVGRAFTEGINSTNKGNNSAVIRLVLALAGIVLFVGAEGTKVFFRKNFGMKGINIFQLVICSLCFIGVGIGCTVMAFDTDNYSNNIALGAGFFSFAVTGIFYLTLGVWILRKGILERMKAIKNNFDSDFRGETDVLKVLEERGWSQNKIRYLGEPLYALALGIVMALFNPIGAIPLVACAISVWGHFVLEFVFQLNPLQPGFAMPATPQGEQRPQQQAAQPIKSNRVNTDF